MHMNVMQDSVIALMIRHSWETTANSLHTTLSKRRGPTRRFPVGCYRKTAVSLRWSAAADVLPRIVGAARFEHMRCGIVSTPGAEQSPAAAPQQHRQQDGRQAVRRQRPRRR